MDKNYNLNTLAENRVINPMVTEVIRQAAYDFALYPLAGTTQIQLFQNPMGQGITSALGAPVGSPKTYADTNMLQAGAFPKPQAMVVESIEIVFEPGASAAANTFTAANPSQFAAGAAASVLSFIADVNTVRQSGWLEWYISSKSYLFEAPLGRFPSKVGLEMKAAIASNSATTGEVAAAFAKWDGKLYVVSPEITLDSQVNFSIKLNWPGALPTPSGFNARIGCILDGVLYRNGQ